MKTQFLLFIVSLILLGCSTDTVGSNDVQAEAIHQEYTLDYQESNNATTISAQFRVGGSTGTTVELEPPAQLSMNGYAPKKSSFLGTSYSYSQSGPLIAAQFHYVDASGTTYNNAVALKSIAITMNPQAVMQGTNYYLPISTYPLEPGDRVSAVIEQEFVEGGIKRFVFIDGQFQTAGSVVVFSSFDLSRLRNGVAYLRLARHHRSPLSSATPRGGGEISSSYSMRPIALTIYGQNFAPSPLLPL